MADEEDLTHRGQVTDPEDVTHDAAAEPPSNGDERDGATASMVATRITQSVFERARAAVPTI